MGIFHARFTNLTEKLKANSKKIQFNLQTSFSVELVSFFAQRFHMDISLF